MLNGKLDKSVPIPLYFQLKEVIVSEIKNGHYEKDSLIPTEKEFMEAYQISRTTVRQAMTELVQEGWLYRVKSKGTFVSYPKISHNFIQSLESFNEQMQRVGSSAKTEVITLEKIKAPEFVAEGLGIKKGDFVVYLFRKRFADEEPVVIQKAYLPYCSCSFLLEKDFTKESLYKSLAGNPRTKITRAKRVVEVDEALEEDVKYLNIQPGKPMQIFITTGYNDFGEAIEFSLARYRGDRSRFEVSAGF